MTRKDYEAIAANVKSTLESINSDAGRIALQMFVSNFCDTAIRDNHRFDHQKFRRACGF